ncbi:PepSY domain-containing protein [Sphingomonadaceae bacterium LXI357]|uniref:PepSY domain-containing protein n=2 Tax=Stakelama marina TaxID=2826939 RepID=A0A8T4ICD5_9SPHN|nr:PepSY domain-containing protein [Stakelama marina]
MKFLPVAVAMAAVPFAVQAQQPAAKISKAQAEAIALKAAPGKIVESDYEKEDGSWRYSFDIRQGQRIHEVGVDAFTGKIVESSYETAGDKD